MRKVILGLVLVMLAGCGQVEDVPEPSVTASRTAVQTGTITNVATVTITQRPLGPPAIPYIGTPFNFVYSTPTPIATPASPAPDFRLKAWNEEDALALIRLMDQYAHDADVIWYGVYRFDFPDDQWPIKLAAHETLFRFPNSTYIRDIQWRIAQSNAILDNPETDAWLINEIEEGLNQGRYTPETLNEDIKPFGFELSPLSLRGTYVEGPEFVLAPNLFGDGRDAKIYQIKARESYDNGLIVALSQDKQGKFELRLVFSKWDFITGGGLYLEVNDHTGDGVPEVIITVHLACSGCFVRHTLIYQWRNGRFVELSEGVINNIGYFRGWEYGPPDENGFETIQVDDWEIDYSFVYSSILKWNGESYKYSHIQTDTVLESYYFGFSWDPENYLETISGINELLSEWPNIQTEFMEFNTNFVDVLRFQRGVLLAMASQSAQARQELESLIESPNDLENPHIVSAARVYLENYNSDRDLYNSCQKALNVINTALEPFYDKYDEPSREGLLKVVGHDSTSYFSARVFILCDLNAAIPIVIESIRASQIDDLPEILRQAGLDIHDSNSLDLNNDGLQDWVIAFSQKSDESRAQIWVVLNHDERLEALLIDDDRLFEAEDKMNVETLTLSGKDHPQTKIHLADWFLLFDVESEGGESSLKNYLEEWGAYRHEARTVGDDFTFNFFDDPGYGFSPWKAYVLEPETGEFIETDLVSELLFQKENPSEAIDLIGYVLKQFGGIEYTYNQQLPRLLYLRALAYELLGDEANAAQAYYELWHDHPDSPYAVMARAKLELVLP